MAASPWTPQTLAVALGRPTHEPDAPLNSPVVMTSTYVAGGPRGYGRTSNPTWEAFEEVLGALEGGRALAFASGMGAVSAVLDLVPVGGVLVVPVGGYSGTMAAAAAMEGSGRAVVRRVDVTDAAAVAEAATGAQLVWLESPTNPLLEVADLPAAAAACSRSGATLVVDNTFATPLLQQPLDLGADVVVHSATKLIAGHSDVLLGAVVVGTGGAADALLAEVTARRTLGGAVPGPFEAWLALRGLRTLPVRLRAAQASATELARRLAGHPAVSRVRYPGLGTIVSIEVDGGAAAADAVCGAARLWTNATSLGGVESTLERRRRWPAESAAVPESLVRLSVGCEDVEDLWTDLEQALRGGH